MDNLQQEAATTKQSGPPWQKLSPIAIVYFAMKILRGLLGNFVYLIPALAYGYSNLLDHPGIGLPVILLLFIMLLLGAFWSFQVYRFRLSKQALEIRSGIFSKKHLNLPFKRIQNVKIVQPIYYRLSGYACLQLDTAGSVKQEANLVALPLTLAEQLKQQILDNRAEPDDTFTSPSDNDTPQEAQPHSSSSEQIINQRSLADLILHGISNNRVWILLGGLAPFYDDIAKKVNQTLQNTGLDLNELFSLQSHPVWQVGLYALSLTLIIMFVLMLFSVSSAIISFYAYTLSKTEGRYIRRSGLFTKHEVSMPLSRLQLVIQQQDWLDSLLKRVNLKFEQINAQLKQEDLSAANSKIIVPSITLQQSEELIRDVYPNNQLFTIPFSPISGFYLLRYIGYFLLPSFAIFVTIAMFEQHYLGAALAVILLLLSSALVYLRWRRWGYAFDDNFIYLRRGLVGVDYYCFPAFKVQQCQYKQSVMMKKRQLATNKYILASGSITLPLLPQSIALKMLDRCLYQVESSKRSWM